jgi:hypothetical protein
VFQIGFTTSTNFLGIFLNLHLIVLSYFRLRVFLIQKIAATGSHLSTSLSLQRARPSARRFCMAATRLRPRRPIKAPADTASPLSEPRRHLTVGAPPDRACPNAAVSAVRVRLTAGLCPTPPPVRPTHRRFPHFTTPLRLTPKPAAAPHHPLPVYAGARREEPPHRRSFDRLCRCDPLHGERSPEHSLAAFFSRYTCA